MTLLQVRSLSKHYRVERGGQTRAVDEVSFALESGEALGVVGESGCGKSTLARLLCGLTPATSGSIRFAGSELVGLSRRGWLPVRRRLQIVFQDPYASLDPRQTVASILTEPLAIHRVGRPRERRVRAAELLETVGLGERHLNRYPHQFSGGERQRIGIARALALEPELLVLDEPVSALDVSIQAQIINLLAELRRDRGLAYLFIAHDLAVVRHLCPRISVMYAGRIVETAARDALFGSPSHPYTRVLLEAIPIPDPHLERARKRKVIQGELGPEATSSEACAFHPRCPDRDRVPNARCVRERPELRSRDSGGLAACHLDG